MNDAISKVVIPAAGLGTRLLTATKEQPKEMLPIFDKTDDGSLCIKPIVQVIYEQLFDYGIREFYFVVGRSKRAIEDHFTPDYDFVESLNRRGKSSYAKEIERFYEKLSLSNIVWINQHAPMGFGHAVLLAKNLIKEHSFLVHAGDTIISSKRNSHIKKLVDIHNDLHAESTLLVRQVKDPKQFGVVIGSEDKNGIVRVKGLYEKPTKPISNLAIMPIYVFRPSIFDSLKKISPGTGNEIQLTDGIMGLVQSGNTVVAKEMNKDDVWIDVGTPTSYWDALSSSFRTNNS